MIRHLCLLPICTLVLALAIALSVALVAASGAQAGFQTCGDPNNDGVADSLDALYILQVSAGLIELPPPAFASTDVNNDGYVDAIDATLVLQYTAGLISELNCA
jgi:hypothetical protein